MARAAGKPRGDVPRTEHSSCEGKSGACKHPATGAGKGESPTDRAAASDPGSGSADSKGGSHRNLLPCRKI